MRKNKKLWQAKLYGILFILASLVPAVIDGDGTLMLLFVPFGAMLLFAKSEAEE